MRRAVTNGRLCHPTNRRTFTHIPPSAHSPCSFPQQLRTRSLAVLFTHSLSLNVLRLSRSLLLALSVSLSLSPHSHTLPLSHTSFGNCSRPLSSSHSSGRVVLCFSASAIAAAPPSPMFSLDRLRCVSALSSLTSKPEKVNKEE